MSAVLSDLQPGDDVAIVHREGARHAKITVRIVKVERVTNTQIVVNGKRWRRDTGQPIPKPRSSWFRSVHLEAPTDRLRHLDEFCELAGRAARLIQNVRYGVPRDWPIDRLRRLVVLLEEDNVDPSEPS